MGNSVKVNIGADGSGFFAVMDKVDHRVKHLSGHLNSELKSNLTSFFGAAAVEAAIHNMVEFATEIEHASKRLGVATDRVQELRATARHAGKDLGFFEGVFRNIEKSAAQALGGDSKKAGIFAKLGITDADLKHLNKADLLKKVLEGTKGLDRTVSEQLLGGIAGQKNGAGLLGMREDITNPEGMNVNKISNEDIEALAQAHIQWEDIIDTLRTGLIPVLVSVAHAVMEFGHNLMQGFKVAFAYVEGLITNIKSFSLKGGIKAMAQGQVENTKAVGKNLWDFVTGKQGIGDAVGNIFSQGAKSVSDDLKGFFGDDAVKAAEDAATTMGEVVDQEDKERDARMKARLDAWKKEQEELNGPVNREPAPAKEAKFKPEANLKGGSEFLKIGGLLGTDSLYRMERLSQESVNLLRQIAKNTTPNPDPYGPDTENPFED